LREEEEKQGAYDVFVIELAGRSRAPPTCSYG